jgi:hypothetical protein
LPRLTDQLTVIRTEAQRVEADAARAGRDKDARADWAEITAKAQGQVAGATRMLDLVKELARG